MVRKRSEAPLLETREFRSPEEIDAAIAKLQRRVMELQELDVQAAVVQQNGNDTVVQSNVRNTIREVFGADSPEFQEHKFIEIWAGPTYIGMTVPQNMHGTELGSRQVITVLQGLVSRLGEKKADLLSGSAAPPSSYFDLNLHPRILEVSRELFMDGHPWDAVFAASKALVNYIKERSGRHDLDGAFLVRTVFSKNAPVLAFNALANPTDLDEQEGMMHLFEGAVLAIRNPGGHSFPEGPEERAIEYLSLLSLLAYRAQEAKRVKP
jgi:uncharacterized protein (TIGR02391 family)